MRIFTIIIMALALGTGACGNDTKKEDLRDGPEEPGTIADPADEHSGGVNLTIPKRRGNEAYLTVRIVQEGDYFYEDDAMPVSNEILRDDEEDFDGDEKEDDHEWAYCGNGMEEHDIWRDERPTIDQFHEFKYIPGKTIRIKDLPEGEYLIEVKILNKKRQPMEYGDAWTDVQSGRMSKVVVHMQPYKGPGGVAIDLCRKGECWDQTEPYPGDEDDGDDDDNDEIPEDKEDQEDQEDK